MVNRGYGLKTSSNFGSETTLASAAGVGPAIGAGGSELSQGQTFEREEFNRFKKRFEIGVASDPGKSGKPNQDYFDIVESKYAIGQLSETGIPVTVGLVADGISAGDGSDVAGQFIVETIRRILVENETIQIKPRLEAAIRRANKEIYENAQNVPSFQNAGATIVAAAIADDQLFIAHVGDSRAYLVRNQQAQLLTIDHRWGQEKVEQGELSSDDAMQHEDRNLLTRYVGQATNLEVDHRIINLDALVEARGRRAVDFNRIQLWPIVDRMWLIPGDSLVLCTDGLTDVLNRGQIEAIVNRNPPQAAAEKLIEMANDAGGPDNITVIVMRFLGTRQQIATPPQSSVQYPLAFPLQQNASPSTTRGRPLPQTLLSRRQAKRNEALQSIAAGIGIFCLGVVLWFAIGQGLIPMLRRSTSLPSLPTPTAAQPNEDATRTVGATVETGTTIYLDGEFDPDSTDSETPIMGVQPPSAQTTNPLPTATAFPVLSPPKGFVGKGVVTFAWQPTRLLQPGEAYELLIWPAGQDRQQSGKGWGGISTASQQILNLDHLGLVVGPYQWGVRIVQITPYQEVEYLGSDYRFTYAP